MLSRAVLGVSGKEPLLALWTVPSFRNQAIGVDAGSSINRVMKEYFSDADKFVIGELHLDADAATRIKKAEEVLFKDPTDRTNLTEEYTRFKEWQKSAMALFKLSRLLKTTLPKEAMQ